MNLETVSLILFLATGNVTAYPPTTIEECTRDRHVIWRWSRVIHYRKAGRLELDGVPVVDAECRTIDLMPCEEGS